MRNVLSVRSFSLQVQADRGEEAQKLAKKTKLVNIASHTAFILLGLWKHGDPSWEDTQASICGR
jgi:hypothetical protein